ncbi:hypothetical protein HK102_006121 [Quaeritorhiza haematococci]|nr:hypothetical protein HK102_006121 [Quaeritorhiza haematococci]
MVAFKSLLAGILLFISPATAAIIDASFDEAVLHGLQQLQFTKVGARATCRRQHDYTHNDQRELMTPSQNVTITTDRCKEDPWNHNFPGTFLRYEIIAFKDNGERMVCGTYARTRIRHAANTNEHKSQGFRAGEWLRLQQRHSGSELDREGLAVMQGKLMDDL